MKTKVLALHGFLGQPGDFDALKNDIEIYSPSLDDYVHLSFKEICLKLQNNYPVEECHILGYSFGARLGLRLFDEFKIKNQKIICLAGHMGLKSQALREERLTFETKMIHLLKTATNQEFLNSWNQFDLFKHDSPCSLDRKFDPLTAALYFENYGLSKQPYLRDKLLSKRDQIQFIYGDLDTKYKTYAINELLDYNLIFSENKGHRLISHLSDFITHLKEFYGA